MSKKKSLLIALLSLVVGVALGVGVTLGIKSGNTTGTIVGTSAEGLVQWATEAVNNNWAYVEGCATEGAVDNVGLIYSYAGGARTFDEMMSQVTSAGSIASIPEIPGIGLYMPGHVGIYVGGGLCIDARDAESGVIMTAVEDSAWASWFYIPGITYETTADNSALDPDNSIQESPDNSKNDPDNSINPIVDAVNSNQNGWTLDDSGNWTYTNEDGNYATEWKDDIPGWNGKWFYFDISNGEMVTGWKDDIPGWEGQMFYFDTSNGVMQTGWKNDIPGYEGKWFYFDVNTGVMATGWQGNIPGWEGQWFYFSYEDGTMQTGWQFIEGYWYYFGTNGVMYVDCVTPDGFSVDENGRMISVVPDEAFSNMTDEEAGAIAERLRNGTEISVWSSMSADEFLEQREQKKIQQDKDE